MTSECWHLAEILILGRVWENQRPVALLGHSLGSLIIDAVCVAAHDQSNAWLGQLKATVRFGVPVLGSQHALLSSWIPGIFFLMSIFDV